MKVIQGHKVKKIKFNILSLGGVMHVFRLDFRQERKNDPRTLFERSKWEEIWKWEKCRNPGEYRKGGLCGHSKRQNSAAFQDRDTKFCTFIYLQAIFYIYSGFSNLELLKNEGSM